MNIISNTLSRRIIDFDAACWSHDDWLATFPNLRKEKPLVWSERHGGYWIISRYTARRCFPAKRC